MSRLAAICHGLLSAFVVSIPAWLLIAAIWWLT